MTQWLQIRNWSRFQHYKSRNPPWIKVYTALLDDFEFHALPEATQLALIYLWLLAARQDNRIPNDPDWLRERLGMRQPPDVGALIAGGWLEPWKPTLSLLAADASISRQRQKDRKTEGGNASLEQEDPQVAEMRARNDAIRDLDTRLRQLP